MADFEKKIIQKKLISSRNIILLLITKFFDSTIIHEIKNKNVHGQKKKPSQEQRVPVNVGNAENDGGQDDL